MHARHGHRIVDDDDDYGDNDRRGSGTGAVGSPGHHRRKRGCAFAAVVSALAAFQYASIASSRTAVSSSSSPSSSSDQVPLAEGVVAAGFDLVTRMRKEEEEEESATGGVGGGSGSAVFLPRVLYLEGSGRSDDDDRPWRGDRNATSIRRRKKRRGWRKRRREVELYPPEISDVTQFYADADSSDFPYNETMKWRAFPPRYSSKDGEKKTKECVPMAEWQTTFRPTCNAFHELDVSIAGMDAGRSDEDESVNGRVQYLGSGSWRNAWRIDWGWKTMNREEKEKEETEMGGGKRGGRRRLTERNETRRVGQERTLRPQRRSLRRKKKTTMTTTTKRTAGRRKRTTPRSDEGPIVLKMWRYEHNFEDEYFEFNRVDAIAMERLTASNYVVDIYGHCGLSLLTEFASESVTAYADKLPPLGKLKLARDVARGLADVHGIDPAADRGFATLVHNDLNTAHIVFRKGGDGNVDPTPLFNDFNVARMQLWDQEADGPCGFKTNMFSPQWRSPEELRSFADLPHSKLTEKVDVYAFGNVLYRFVTGQRAWRKGHGSLTEEYQSEIAEKKREGETPPLPDKVTNSTDPATRALLRVMDMAYQYDPDDRPSAAELAKAIDEAAAEIEASAKDFIRRK